MLCKTFPFFSPNKATAEVTHSHVQARVFSHKGKKNNKTIKELSVIQLIKNSFNWHNVWPGWQVQPHCVTSPGQDLALINGGRRLVWRWRNRDRSASAVKLNTSSWALPGHMSVCTQPWPVWPIKAYRWLPPTPLTHHMVFKWGAALTLTLSPKQLQWSVQQCHSLNASVFHSKTGISKEDIFFLCLSSVIFFADFQASGAYHLLCDSYYTALYEILAEICSFFWWTRDAHACPNLISHRLLQHTVLLA